MAVFEGFRMLIGMALLLQPFVFSRHLPQPEMGDEEYIRDALQGQIEVNDYKKNFVHSWYIFAPDHTPTESKRYSFQLLIDEMDIPHAKEITIDGHSQIRDHVDADQQRCVSFLHFNRQRYCGYLTREEKPLDIVVDDVHFVRVDFQSDDSDPGRGFRGSYRWIEQPSDRH